MRLLSQPEEDQKRPAHDPHCVIVGVAENRSDLGPWEGDRTQPMAV